MRSKLPAPPNTRLSDMFRHPLTMHLVDRAPDRLSVWPLIKMDDLDADDAWLLYRDFKELEKFAKQLSGRMRDQLLARKSNEEFSSEYVGEEVSGSVVANHGRETFDKEAFIKEYGQEVYNQFVKVGNPYSTVNYKDI